MYLQLDLNKSEQKLKDWARLYNASLTPAKVEQLNAKLEKTGDYWYRPENGAPLTKKAHLINSSNISTMLYLQRAFHLHLQLMDRMPDDQPGAAFKVNNVAISTMRLDQIGFTKSTGSRTSTTAFRQLKKLEFVGLLTKKSKKGAINTGYEVQINPEILINKIPVNNLFVSAAQDVNNSENSENSPQNPENATRLFSFFSSGQIAVCNDILTRTLQDRNINMKEGANNSVEGDCLIENFKQEVAKIGMDPQKFSKQEQIQEHRSITDGSTRENENSGAGGRRGGAAGPAIDSTEGRNRKHVAWFAEILVKIIISYLKPIINNEKQDITAAIEFIKGYFEDQITSANPHFYEKYYRIVRAIIRTRRWKFKDITRGINLVLYCDPSFEHGINKYLTNWDANWKEEIKKQKDWNSNMKILSKCIFEWEKAGRNAVKFQEINQFLGKKRSQEPLRLFNMYALDKELFEKEIGRAA